MAAVSGDYHACMWAAIRAGWRQEYSVACEGERDTVAYTRFVIDGADIKAAARQHEEIRQARALLKAGGDFDFEVALGAVDGEALTASLEQLRELGHAPQLALVGQGNGEALSEVARHQRITLSFRYAGESGTQIERLARATAGRLNYYVNTPAEADTVAEHLLG